MDKGQVVEESCHFQVVVLPASAVIANVSLQLSVTTSRMEVQPPLIHVLCLGVPVTSLVC